MKFYNFLEYFAFIGLAGLFTILYPNEIKLLPENGASF